jgi:hypothetical protein
MSTQQSLFSGWNSFGGCSTPQPPQQQPPQHHCGCNGERTVVDIDVHHYRRADGSWSTYSPRSCGGPFACPSGSAASTNQNYSAFGSHGGCSNWQPSCNCTPFFASTYQNFGYGNTGCLPHPTGYIGQYPTSGYGGYQGQYPTSGYGGYQGQYPTSGYGGYQGQYSNGCYGGYQGGYGNGYTPTPLPCYNWGDFGNCFGNANSCSPFGIVPSAYPSYALNTSLPDIGTMNTMSILGGALAMLF